MHVYGNHLRDLQKELEHPDYHYQGDLVRPLVRQHHGFLGRVWRAIVEAHVLQDKHGRAVLRRTQAGIELR